VIVATQGQECQAHIEQHKRPCGRTPPPLWQCIHRSHLLHSQQFTLVQVATAQTGTSGARPRSVFLKAHTDDDTFRFDNLRARDEVDNLNRFRRDDVLRYHIPRLRRTTWLDIGSAASALRSSATCGSGLKMPPLEGYALVLEFEREAGRSLSEHIDEV
jgi:hypothetical protein